MQDPLGTTQEKSEETQTTNPRRGSLLRRSALASLALLGALLLASGVFTFFAGTPAAKALPLQTASVIVQFDDNARVARNIQFTDPISGLTALQLADLNVVISDTSFGPAVCAIEGVGCPQEDCFCAGSSFWGYSYYDGATWQSYPVGAGSSVISQTGAIEGWRWGEWGSALASPVASLASTSGLDWLSAQQVITSGGFGSSMGAAVEGMLAFGANNVTAEDVRRSADSPSLADFSAANGAAYSRASASAAGKLATALVSADACLPANALLPSDYYSPTIGAYAEGSGDNAWALLGIAASQGIAEPSALDALRAAQQADGGWEWSAGWGSDTNSTALAVQALVANGESITSTVIVSAVAYLKDAQNDDGGFPYSAGPDADSDANSTAYVIQALIAAGEDPEGAAWEKSDVTPVDYLLGMQTPSGAFEWTPGTGENALATTQALPALLGRAHPVVTRELSTCPVAYLPVIATVDDVDAAASIAAVSE